MADSAERRRFYRLRYPEEERPVALAENRVFRVAELSEEGVRIVLADGQPAVGVAFAGYVRFPDDQVATVEGVVLRHEGAEAVVYLTVGVPLRRMLAEQQRLIRLFPTLSDTPTDPS
jgi:hypothetical protein